MTFNRILFHIGCAIAWLVVLPLFVGAGAIALLLHALFSECGDAMFGGNEPLGAATAREIASRTCMTRRSLRTH